MILGNVFGHTVEPGSYFLSKLANLALVGSENALGSGRPALVVTYTFGSYWGVLWDGAGELSMK